MLKSIIFLYSMIVHSMTVIQTCDI